MADREFPIDIILRGDILGDPGGGVGGGSGGGEGGLGGRFAGLAALRLTLGPVVAGLAGFVTAAAAAGATIFGFAKAAANAGEELHEMSQRVGITADRLSELKFSAELGGASLESVATSVRILSKSMLDATHGLERKSEAFRTLGIQVTDARGQLRSTDEVLRELADRFKLLEDGTLKTALAYEIFGGRGVEMIPVLNKGSAELDRQRQMAERLGLTFTREAAKAADEFNDRVTELWGSLRGLKDTIGKELIPVIEPMVVAVRDAVIKMREIIGGPVQTLLNFGASLLLEFGGLVTERGLEVRIDVLRREIEALERGGPTFFGLLPEAGTAEDPAVVLKLMQGQLREAEAALKGIRDAKAAETLKGLREEVERFTKDQAVAELKRFFDAAAEAAEALKRADKERIEGLIKAEQEARERSDRIEADRIADLIRAEEEADHQREARARDRLAFEVRLATETHADILRDLREMLEAGERELLDAADFFAVHGQTAGEQFAGGFTAGLVRLQQELGTFGENVQGVLQGVGNAWARTLDDAFFSVITGQVKKLEDVFKQLAASILREFTAAAARQATGAIVQQLPRLVRFG